MKNMHEMLFLFNHQIINLGSKNRFILILLNGIYLFFNLRYFEQVFVEDLKSSLENGSSSSLSDAFVGRIINFYFTVTYHELSRNIDSNHDLNFINRLERVSVRLMDAKDAFISKYSF
jgi:hypothetical protein